MKIRAIFMPLILSFCQTNLLNHLLTLYSIYFSYLTMSINYMRAIQSYVVARVQAYKYFVVGINLSLSISPPLSPLGCRTAPLTPLHASNFSGLSQIIGFTGECQKPSSIISLISVNQHLYLIVQYVYIIVSATCSQLCNCLSLGL